MRFYITIYFAALLVGCQSPRISDEAKIETSLEKRITIEEAHRIAFDQGDRLLQKIQALPESDEKRAELRILIKQRQKHSVRLESFLSHFRKGDELWTYRTYVTSDKRGGNSGFAIVRNGRVVDQKVEIIHD